MELIFNWFLVASTDTPDTVLMPSSSIFIYWYITGLQLQLGLGFDRISTCLHLVNRKGDVSLVFN